MWTGSDTYERLTERVVVRMTSAEKAELRHRAEAADLSVSALVRQQTFGEEELVAAAVGLNGRDQRCS